MTDIPAALLKEAHRVLRYGGRFFCLEFSTNEWPGFAQVYDAYLHHLVPKLGKLIADDEDSYRYLIESIRRFPPMPLFAQMICDAGFTEVKVEPIWADWSRSIAGGRGVRSISETTPSRSREGQRDLPAYWLVTAGCGRTPPLAHSPPPASGRGPR